MWHVRKRQEDFLRGWHLVRVAAKALLRLRDWLLVRERVRSDAAHFTEADVPRSQLRFPSGAVVGPGRARRLRPGIRKISSRPAGQTQRPTTAVGELGRLEALQPAFVVVGQELADLGKIVDRGGQPDERDIVRRRIT